MGDRAVRNLLIDEAPIVEQFSNTLHGAVVFAQSVQDSVKNVQDSLDDIKDNTKRLFWWSSTFVCICLGLFLLAQLVRVREEMGRMVHYQEVFKRMWEEDKIIEQERVEEERRERRFEAQRRAAARQSRPSGQAAQRRAPGSSGFGRRTDDDNTSQMSGYRPERRQGPSPFGPAVDSALDNAPPPGPQRDEWIHALASMTQERRQAHYQQQQQQQYQGEEIDIEEDAGYWG